MNSIRTYSLSVLLLTMIAAVAASDTFAAGERGASGKGILLGTVGATYPIAEPDALTDIEEAAKQVNWEKVFEKKKMEKMIRSYRPSGLISLPRTKISRSYSVDMTYTLTQDIPDGRGGVLYPSGYSFNPLQYVSLPNILVFINGADPEQVEWYGASPYAKEPRATLLLTDGNYAEIMEKVKRPVYYANGSLLSRMKLTAVPALAIQKGSMIEVHEIDAPRKRESK